MPRETVEINIPQRPPSKAYCLGGKSCPECGRCMKRKGFLGLFGDYECVKRDCYKAPPPKQFRLVEKEGVFTLQKLDAKANWVYCDRWGDPARNCLKPAERFEQLGSNDLYDNIEEAKEACRKLNRPLTIHDI